jgi:predicted nucleic acid-binding protein
LTATLYAHAALLDTSIVFARHCERDRRHSRALAALQGVDGLTLCALNVTSHETFTRLRKDVGLEGALAGYEFIRTSEVRVLDFVREDEEAALRALRKYADKQLSFHDALCAAVMMRNGIFRIISFDSDFFAFGFEVIPGPHG